MLGADQFVSLYDDLFWARVGADPRRTFYNHNTCFENHQLEFIFCDSLLICCKEMCSQLTQGSKPE